MRTFLLLIFTISFSCLNGQTVRILFDASKGEQTGNADWVIDADQYNVCINSSGNIYTNIACSESNAQRAVTPPDSTVNTSTAENYWSGGLSAWAVECAKRGYKVESLPYNGQITYGNTSNAQDLSKYRIFVLCEPNINFTPAQKTAIINFVGNGGRLFMVADHWGSDRNFDGDQSVTAFNDLMFNNGINNNNPFGMKLDTVNYSGTTSNKTTYAFDSLINGPYGSVTQMKWSGGTTITIDTSKNNSVRASFYKTGVTQNSNNIFAAYARYGKGKVVLFGDSSPFDDGTGDPGDVLYDGWLGDVSGNHRKMIMNATVWLANFDSFKVTINPSGPTTFCTGDSVMLTASAAVSYAWSNGKTSSSISVKTANTYSVTATNSLGQTASKSIQVNVLPLPNPVLSKKSDTLFTGDFKNYQWYRNDTFLSSFTQSFITPKVSGNYKVVVSDSSGCIAISNEINYMAPVIEPAGISKLNADFIFKQMNKIIFLENINQENFEINIFDALGKKIMHLKDRSSYEVFTELIQKNILFFNIKFKNQTQTFYYIKPE